MVDIVCCEGTRWIKCKGRSVGQNVDYSSEDDDDGSPAHSLSVSNFTSTPLYRVLTNTPLLTVTNIPTSNVQSWWLLLQPT